MQPLLPVIVIVFSFVAHLYAQNVKAVDQYYSDPRPVAGLGIGEEKPRNRRPELSPRIEIPINSRETEETSLYADDSLERRIGLSDGYHQSTIESDRRINSGQNQRNSHRQSAEDTEYRPEKHEEGGIRSSDDYYRSTIETESRINTDQNYRKAQPLSVEEDSEYRPESLESGVDPNYDSSHHEETPKVQTTRQSQAARVVRGPHPVSPCPSVFSYEGTKAGKDRWYGVVLVTTSETLTGVRLEIQLDKPAHLLGAWLGEVSSVDNIRYTIWNGRRKIEPGPPLSVKIFVKFSEQDANPPRLRSIKLNGRRICPKDKGPSVPTPPKLPTPTRPNPAGNPKPTQPTRPPVTRPTTPGGGGSFVCGKIDPQPSALITHGQKTARGQWPWHIALYTNEKRDLKYICGGSLVGERHVITAAHCVTRKNSNYRVDPETLVVYLGKYNLKLWSEGGVQNKQVYEIHISPDFNSTTLSGDIAILFLSSVVQFTSFVKPVCIWDRNRVQLGEIEGALGTVVGWGIDETGETTEELMMAKMPVVSYQTCVLSYPDFFSRFTSDKTFCAGFRNGTSVCNGDSGGGMVFPKGTGNAAVWYLRGIVSLSTPKENERVCNPKHYVVFTDMTKYLTWIYQHI